MLIVETGLLSAVLILVIYNTAKLRNGIESEVRRNTKEIEKLRNFMLEGAGNG